MNDNANHDATDVSFIKVQSKSQKKKRQKKKQNFLKGNAYITRSRAGQSNVA